ncbi:nitrate- and nitrite sensing domain-containing protein [Nocardia asteroides]|uniref:sensor histidine kinase n=1 Tax=Nocardia asteroides TaxID=1824 RepID=UPI001E39D08A|nr:nitrate- and nitrite sensing domain-containing protein [Nocardia asteroides]UGT62356.1 nitrate- and nitrite sensing domain-containing protein [Nocardia asteroides]
MFTARLGVRTRVLAIALVPSLSLLAVGVGTTSYLVSESNRTHEWAVQTQAALAGTRDLVEGAQAERLASMARLTGNAEAAAGLAAARAKLDGSVRALESAKTSLGAVEDDLGDVGGIDAMMKYLSQLRTAIDAGQLPAADAYNFFNQVIDGIVLGSQISQQLAPDAEIGVELAEAMQILKSAEAMSRATALAVALESGQDAPAVPVEEFARQVGYYRIEIGNLSRDVDPEQKEVAAALTNSVSWQKLDVVENVIGWRAVTRAAAAAEGGAGSSSARASALPPLPMPNAEWQAAAADVNRQLVDMWIAQSARTNGIAENKADEDSENALLAGIGVGTISLLAIGVSVLLANRIIRRLKRLRSETLTLADVTLPEMMRKLENNEPVDPATEMPKLDFGTDEIGEVAKAFEHAANAAVNAAVAEARTREGVKSVFLNIAHRSQVVVHRQLEILDEAERKQEDPALLDTLFRLDHLATRERRNAENLIILGGGQVGRQWRNPVAMIDLVRSAVGETLDYSRVRVARMPQVHVLGGVVADLVHLLAELVDNATTFSPPQSRVEVTGNVVGRGVVVEIEDQGMGMPTGDIVRTNQMMADPPDFGVASLSGDSRLGLFVVARLAVRHDIAVKLAESDYGGIRAIVLIPSALLAGAVPDGQPTSTAAVGRPVPIPALESPVRHAESAASAPLPAATLVADPPMDTQSFRPPVESQPYRPPEQPSYTGERPQPYNPNTPAPSRPAVSQPPAAQPLLQDGRPALPRRNRQTNLNPQLDRDPEPTTQTRAPERPRLTADQARDLISAIENGTRQGRKPLSGDASGNDRQEG